MITPKYSELKLLHSKICRAVGDPRRIQILYALHFEPTNVSALADQLDIPQPSISRHLAILRQSSLVVGEREGATITYRLTAPRIITVLDMMREVLKETLEQQVDFLD